jgi:hypothetical protein
VLCENLCKHQVVIFLICINLTKDNIIQYYGTWYGSNHGGFATMFVDLTYLHLYDNEFDDEEPNEDNVEEPWVFNMGGLLTLDDISPNVEGNKDDNQPSISNAPTKKALAQINDVVQEIINEVKEGGIQLIDHATSLLCVVASNVQNIHLSKVNEIMRLGMVFHHINDGPGNLVHQMKDWHETMLKHANIHRKRVHE